MALLRLCILMVLVAVVAACGGGAPSGGRPAEEEVVPSRLPPVPQASPAQAEAPSAQEEAAQARSEQVRGESPPGLSTKPDAFPGGALTVAYRGGSFLPKRLEVPAGQTVTFGCLCFLAPTDAARPQSGSLGPHGRMKRRTGPRMASRWPSRHTAPAIKRSGYATAMGRMPDE